MRRLSRDEYFLSMANIVASRATCDRLWAGCVLVVDGAVAATGYNGAPAGMAECDEVDHLMVEGADGRPHCKRTIHAEQNALYQAKNKYKNLQGATAYINATPCEICLSELLKWGVKRVVCGSVYRNAERVDDTSKLVSAWSAVIEYHPMPDISLTFGTEVTDVKRIEIARLQK
jgi:dCMP deaminase